MSPPSIHYNMKSKRPLILEHTACNLLKTSLSHSPIGHSADPCPHINGNHLLNERCKQQLSFSTRSHGYEPNYFWIQNSLVENTF